MSAHAGAAEFHKPFSESHVNHLYNLLFCDDLALFKSEEVPEAGSVWAILFSEKPDHEALERIASSQDEESRVRALAYNRLRSLGQPVKEKVILGVIVEVRLDAGLDVLAAYPDGRVRYLNQSGKVAIFDGGPPQIEELAKEVVAASEELVNQIGPWDKERLPAPQAGNARITFLVSDGLYFGEGAFEALQQDPMGGPVLSKAAQLLQLSVDTVVSD